MHPTPQQAVAVEIMGRQRQGLDQIQRECHNQGCLTVQQTHHIIANSRLARTLKERAAACYKNSQVNLDRVSIWLEHSRVRIVTSASAQLAVCARNQAYSKIKTIMLRMEVVLRAAACKPRYKRRSKSIRFKNDSTRIG